MTHAKTRAGARALAALCAAALCCLALAPRGLAAMPSHLRDEARDVTGLNHACGVATDTEGDLYLASAGTGEIRVYDPEHNPLTSVEDTHQPCALAVDSRGDVFVSERATGEVVRYLPDAYPFEGAPAYGPREVIDASGEAQGISADTAVLFERFGAADSSADSLYVAEGDHIDAYSNERQAFRISAAGGTYKLRYEGEETTPLPYEASQAEVREALEALPAIGEGDVAVAITNRPFPSDTTYGIVFVGALGLTDVGQVEVDGSGLTNGKFAVNETIHIQGGLGSGETQRVSVSGANGGSFKLVFKDEETGPIPYNAPANRSEGSASVEAALESLAAIEAGDISVCRLGSGTGSFEVAFGGSYAATDVPQIKAISSLLPNEVQRVDVNATAGYFKLIPTTAVGEGVLTPGSKQVTGVTTALGSFRVGDAIQGTELPAGTTITAVGAGTLELSAAPGKINFRTAELTATETTAPVEYHASATELQSALEDLAGIEVGDISVTGGPGATNPYLVTFKGAYAGANVPRMERDQSALSGTAVVSTDTGGPSLRTSTYAAGWSGHIGEGQLTEATGVAAYTYAPSPSNHTYHLAVADASEDEVKLFSAASFNAQKLRRTLKGPKEGEEFGFGPAGAYLAADPGSCPPEGQACTAGHFLLYDHAHEAIDEFEADGALVSQTPLAFPGAEPTALAVDRSGGAGKGTLYVTTGAGAGARALAFGPLVAPSRSGPLEAPLSLTLKGALAVAVDSYGNRYVGVGSKVKVYPPSEGAPLSEIETGGTVYRLAVDGEGNVYVLFWEKTVAVYFAPESFPPGAGTKYAAAVTVARSSDFESTKSLEAMGLNPANGRLYVSLTENSTMIEYGSAAEGSEIIDDEIGAGLRLPYVTSIAAYGQNGDIYLGGGFEVNVLDSEGREVLTQITGTGSPSGPFDRQPGGIAVDQSNGHVLVFNPKYEEVREFDAAGAYVASFGSFEERVSTEFGVAVDNGAHSPNRGAAYLAYDDPSPDHPYDLTAFGPLSYGEAPEARTGTANGLGGGKATLNGSIDPRGFEVEDCAFQYLSEAEYRSNLEAAEAEGHKEAAGEGYGFAAAAEAPCAPAPAEIGQGAGAVAVHAGLSGLEPGGRYRFRLLATNEYGAGTGRAGLFGPPLLSAEAALPVLYDEATLRARIDPSGLATSYRFQYGTGAGYGQSTPATELAPGDGAVAVTARLEGLGEGTEYHFRLLAENEAGTALGPGRTLRTLARRPAEQCANAAYRTGPSANLPDCRAYELLTPAETRGATPYAAGFGDAGRGFSSRLASPDGERLSYFTDGTLPGFDGTGLTDGFRARRAAGEHPAAGWTSALVGPSFAQTGGSRPVPHGVAPDQLHSVWEIEEEEELAGALPNGAYLGAPDGFEALGEGSLGTDPGAKERYIAPGGAHVIFTSTAHLEPAAAPPPAEAVYDRRAGSAVAEAISVKPGGSPFGAFEGADYVAANEDGSAVLFKVNGTLYLHRGAASTEIAEAPNGFAGVSDDGERVFYQAAGALYACDAEAGPCAGPAAHPPIAIASEAIAVNVCADGSRAFFTSEEALTGPEANENGEAAVPGAHNLYAWDGSGTRFVAILDPADLVEFEGGGIEQINLLRWAASLGVGDHGGRAASPTRSTPDGSVLVFQSHAQLTAYENEGVGEIYRYAPGAPPGERLTCPSCDPSGAPPGVDALLEDLRFESGLEPTIAIANLTADGGELFFQSFDRLLPEDANKVEDVYEWQAKGAGGCEGAGGCLALVSSGQGERDSYLYGMSDDGRDVFFRTVEKLVPADVPGSPSIYDARAGGGIPEAAAPIACHGEACRGPALAQPAFPSPASEEVAAAGNPGARPPHRQRCPRGRHRVKHRCVAKRHKRRVRHHRAHRAGRSRGVRG